ncbi:hypothetical protein KUL152_21300 [Tenacibaculum sp. KUL152]|nr:hypothetical protein KUL152_21300 [Tenacibaculum sp. KUL152]
MSKSSEQSHPMHDPTVKSLMQRMEPHIAQSFTIEQQLALARVVGLRGGRVHSIDMRATVKFPFLPWSFYLVFLAGKNRRPLTAKEKAIAAASLFLIATLTVMILSLLGLVALYIIKSLLGINLFESFSLGLFDWLKSS